MSPDEIERQYQIEERAMIMHHDGGMPLAEAKRRAIEEVDGLLALRAEER
jgi:hypothetical protein